MEEYFRYRPTAIFHCSLSVVVALTFCIILLSSFSIQASSDKTVITLKDLTEAVTERSCSCAQNAEILKKNDEYLRLLLKISSVRIVSTLQNLAHHVNAEISYFIESSRWKLYEEMTKHFPRLLSQPSVADSIDALVDTIRNQLFITTDISPQRVGKEVEKAVQKFFVQLIPPTFLCITTGPCKSVSQSYANCLQNNSPSWRAFFGREPSKICAALRQAILRYRLIEGTIDKLHRSAMEIEAINDSCVTRYTQVTNCASVCIPKQALKQEEEIGYCSEGCKNAVRTCLHESASDWDGFISILRKLSTNFDKGFVELEKGIIRSISYAMEMRAPVIAKTVLRKCGRLNFAKALDDIRHVDHQKSEPIQRRAVLMIRQFTSYVGRWRQLVNNICSDPSLTSKCWNGSAVIDSSAEIISNVNNGQSKSSIGSAAIGSSSAKEMNGIEGSGNGNTMMEWSDDEDLGGEGSGAHGEGSGDVEDVQDQPIVPVITSEDVRQTGSTVRLTTTVYTEPTLKTWPATRPPVIGKPPEAGSTDRSTLSVLTAFVIVLWVPLLLR